MALKDFFFKPKKDKAGNAQSNQYELFRGTDSLEKNTSAWEPRYVVRQEHLTGVSEYSYYYGDQLLGSASAMVLPSFPVTIRGSGLLLCTEFDKTVFPGVTRELMDPDNREVMATVIWYGDGTHALNYGKDSLIVKSEEGVWRFLRQGRGIATLRRNGAPGSELTLTAHDPIPDDLAVLMLSFPLIQIAR